MSPVPDTESANAAIPSGSSIEANPSTRYSAISAGQFMRSSSRVPSSMTSTSHTRWSTISLNPIVPQRANARFPNSLSERMVDDELHQLIEPGVDSPDGPLRKRPRAPTAAKTTGGSGGLPPTRPAEPHPYGPPTRRR